MVSSREPSMTKTRWRLGVAARDLVVLQLAAPAAPPPA